MSGKGRLQRHGSLGLHVTGPPHIADVSSRLNTVPVKTVQHTGPLVIRMHLPIRLGVPTLGASLATQSGLLDGQLLSLVVECTVHGCEAIKMTSKLPPVIRERALQIAHHEMGHYVVARALGFATGGVTLSVTMDLRHQGGASITLSRPIASMEAMKTHLEARLMVLLAGAMGQTLSSTHSIARRVDKAQAVSILKGAQGAEQDYAKVKELQHLLRNIACPDTHPVSSDQVAAQLKVITDDLWVRTQKIVEERAETICGLASVLVDGMAIVEQWGRPGDTYEVVLPAATLERLGLVRGIPLVLVAPPH